MAKTIIAFFLFFFLLGCSTEQGTEDTSAVYLVGEPLGEPPEDMHSLIDGLSDESYGARANASNALTEIGEPAVPYIIDSLSQDSYNATDSTSFNSRWNKVNVLGRIGSAAAEDALIDRILNDEETHVRWRSIWALSTIGAGEKKMEMALADPETEWRAAIFLGSKKNPKAIPVLVDGLKNEDDWIRWEGVYVLGILSESSTAMDVAELLDDGSERIRQETALTLGKIGNPVVVPDLIEALDDSSAGVRWRAASSLSKLGDETTVPVLQNAYDIELDETANEFMEKSLADLEKRVSSNK